jgi:hypothetical protein
VRLDDTRRTAIPVYDSDFDFHPKVVLTKRCKINDPILYRGDYKTLGITVGRDPIRGGWKRAVLDDVVVGCISPDGLRLYVSKSRLRYEADTIPELVCEFRTMEYILSQTFPLRTSTIHVYIDAEASRRFSSCGYTIPTSKSEC